MSCVIVIVALAACHGTNTDVRPDAATQMPIHPPAGPHYHYVVNHVSLPTTLADARIEALDVDGNGHPDNNFGIGLTALAEAGFDLQDVLDRAIADRSITLLVDLQTESFGDAADPAAITLYTGTQLAGSDSFAVAPWATHYAGSTPVPGTVSSGVFEGATRDPQIAWTHVELALIGPTPLTLTLRDTHIVASSIGENAIGKLTLAGAIGYQLDWNDSTTDSVVGALAPELEAIVARDCTTLNSPPSCGCPAGSLGGQILEYFDQAAPDCRVSADDIDASGFFAGDDLQLGGPWDGGVSFGIELSAVAATFDTSE
jgi:hypothetical protein